MTGIRDLYHHEFRVSRAPQTRPRRIKWDQYNVIKIKAGRIGPFFCHHADDGKDTLADLEFFAEWILFSKELLRGALAKHRDRCQPRIVGIGKKTAARGLPIIY